MVEKPAPPPAVAARVHQLEEHLDWLTDYVRNLDLSGDGGEPPDLSAIEADIADLDANLLQLRRAVGAVSPWAFNAYGSIANWESMATAIWGTASVLDQLRNIGGTRKSIVAASFTSTSQMTELLEDHGSLQKAIYGTTYSAGSDLGVKTSSLIAIIRGLITRLEDAEARITYLETH